MTTLKDKEERGSLTAAGNHDCAMLSSAAAKDGRAAANWGLGLGTGGGFASTTMPLSTSAGTATTTHQLIVRDILLTSAEYNI